MTRSGSEIYSMDVVITELSWPINIILGIMANQRFNIFQILMLTTKGNGPQVLIPMKIMLRNCILICNKYKITGRLIWED